MALAIPACGGGEPSASGRETAAGVEPHLQPATGAVPCEGKLDGFLDALDVLRSRLVTGLSYGAYLREVRQIRGLYGRIPFDRLTLDCVAAVGTPSEKALNRYTEAANVWGECLEEVGCDAYAVEPKLQHRWRIASRLLSEAHMGSRSVGQASGAGGATTKSD